MQDTEMSESHLLTHEVNVELNMLRATMMNGVGGELDGGDNVTVDNSSLGHAKVQLLKKLPEP